MAFNRDMDQSERRAWAMELAVKIHEGRPGDNDEICLTAEYIFWWVHHDASAGMWNPRHQEPIEGKKW